MEHWQDIDCLLRSKNILQWDSRRLGRWSFQCLEDMCAFVLWYVNLRFIRYDISMNQKKKLSWYPCGARPKSWPELYPDRRRLEKCRYSSYRVGKCSNAAAWQYHHSSVIRAYSISLHLLDRYWFHTLVLNRSKGFLLLPLYRDNLPLMPPPL